MRTKNFLVTILAIAGLALAPATADNGTDHQSAQSRPILLGTSGGNTLDISSLFCCSGTLGSLVEDSLGTQYILSNNHVLGRSNLAVVGDPVNQPGMIDQNCQASGTVATFSDLVPIQFTKGRKIKWNDVDAAIAVVAPGAVDFDGTIMDVGPLSATAIDAFVGQAVQKSGRTSGHTVGTVLAIDVSTSVGYSKECGGQATRIAYFQNQIRIGNADFSTGGDSGSLIAESGTTDPANGLPRAVALLFAGDGTSTIASPIGQVLSALNVSMVEGIPAPSGPTGTLAGRVTNADSGAPLAGATVTAGTGSGSSDANGDYSFDVAVGTYDVSASAAGFASATQTGAAVLENQTTTVNLALAPSPDPTIALPACVGFDTSGGRNHDKNLLLTVRVQDDFGNAVPGAIVDISVDRDGTFFGTGTGASTDSNGEVTYQARNAADGTYVITVTDIRASGLVFSGAASTPTNSFAKGTDSVPTDFCVDGVLGNSATRGSGTPLDRARSANKRNSASLMGLEGVVGHGVGIAGDSPVIEVYLSSDASPGARGRIPSQLDGVEIRIVETDGFIAY